MRRIAGCVLGAALLVGATLGGVMVGHSEVKVGPSPSPKVGLLFNPSSPAPPPNEQICSNPGGVLTSPWTYDGAASPSGTPYTSGTPGLPTYGAPGTDFPNVTAGFVAAPGAVGSTLVWTGSNDLYYLEPGVHFIGGAYFGSNSVYVGGYSSSAGRAVIDGHGYENFPGSSTQVANNTYEYLTVRNYMSSQNSFILGGVNGGSFGSGNTYKYNVIGPNNYAWNGPSIAPRHGLNDVGGYAIGGDNNTVIEYNCIQQNDQGGFNIGGGMNAPATGNVVEYNEFAYNGYGEFPDPCGCVSTAGKFFWTKNFVFMHNYVHNGYSVGVWGDFNNAGANISDNYIANNYGDGIMYEASYNANISNNVLVGNSTSLSGAWPTQTGGHKYGAGYGWGAGAVPTGAIYLPNTGGNASYVSNYDSPSTGCPVGYTDGCLLVQNNTLINNWGGVIVYTDSGRFSGGRVINQPNPPFAGTVPTYLQDMAQWEAWQVTVTAGSTTITAGAPFVAFYTSNGSFLNTAQTPSCSNQTCLNGSSSTLYAFGEGIPSPDPVTCSSDTTCTLANPATVSGTNQVIDISAPGGCGLYDLYNSTQGAITGNPPADYFDNCIWGSRNVLVSGNVMSLDSNVVPGCTTGSGCGINETIAFADGLPSGTTWWGFYDSYFPGHTAIASSPLNNVWKDNKYVFTGTGGDAEGNCSAGQWCFVAGDQGNTVTHATWTSTYGQDSGSTGL